MTPTAPGRSPRRLYAAHVVPGLEAIAAGELAERVPGTRLLGTLAAFDERTSLLTFRSAAPPPALLALRTTDDVFALLIEDAPLSPSRAGLHATRRLVAGMPQLEAAAQLRFQLSGRRGRRSGHTTFRVVARKAGEHAFRRVDLQRAVELGLAERVPHWRLVPDDAQVEVWVTAVGPRLWLGVRLSDASMRQRGYKLASLPASLKPTVAAAMARLSEPREDDVVLDPMCGAGTILIERALAGRYARLLGGDADPAAVAAARENVGPRYKPIELRRWDARRLPLDDASVTAILTNPPFGRQIGSPEDNRALYPAMVAEWMRVLRPGGRVVCLTGERRLMDLVLRAERRLQVAQRVPVLVRGYPATIYVATTSKD